MMSHQSERLDLLRGADVRGLNVRSLMMAQVPVEDWPGVFRLVDAGLENRLAIQVVGDALKRGRDLSEVTAAITKRLASGLDPKEAVRRVMNADAWHVEKMAQKAAKKQIKRAEQQPDRQAGSSAASHSGPPPADPEEVAALYAAFIWLTCFFVVAPIVGILFGWTAVVLAVIIPFFAAPLFGWSAWRVDRLFTRRRNRPEAR